MFSLCERAFTHSQRLLLRDVIMHVSSHHLPCFVLSTVVLDRLAPSLCVPTTIGNDFLCIDKTSKVVRM